MTEPTLSPSRKRSSRLRKLLFVFVGLFGLLVLAYFIVTSSGFFKVFILPRASKAVNATITIDSASISPFSQVVLRNLKIQTSGTEPLVTAAEVRLRYHLFAILGGNIAVDEVTLTSPVINVVQNADGTSNLDPLTKSKPAKETKETKPAAKSKPPQVDIKKVTLSNATIRQTKIRTDGQRETTELCNVNFNLANLKNGQTGKLTIGADVKLDQPASATATNGNLAATIAGEYDFSFTVDLKPASVKGNTHLAVSQAGGAMSELSGLAADLDCEVTPTEIKGVALNFLKSGKTLGGLRVSGPFDAEKGEGRINVELLALDRQVLNLAGASSGMDFGSTTINATNQIELTRGGQVIVAGGRLTAARVQITRAGQTTPTLDASVNYNVTIDRTARSAHLQTLTIDATQTGDQLVHAELSSPMTLAWGGTASAVGDSALNLTVTNFNLADWKPFIGESASAGLLNAKASLFSQSAGKQLAFNLECRVANATVKAGGNTLTHVDLTASAHGQATDLKQFKLAEYSLQVARSGQAMLSVTGAGDYDAASATAAIDAHLQAILPALLQAFPQTNLTCSSGTMELTAHVEQKGQAQTVTGQFKLASLTAKMGANDFRDFSLAADLDVAKTGGKIDIRKAAGKLAEGANPGGTFDVTGNYDTALNSGQITAKLTDLNQNGLRAFLEPMLAEKKLVSIAINATVTAQIDPKADSSVKAELKVANLIVKDPAGQFPSSALEARWQLDAGLKNKVADVRLCQVTLTPTSRAKNELNFTGHVDLSQTNATTGNLKLAADSLDLTSYYDLFSGKPAPGTPAAAAPATPPPANPASQEEPKAIKLPFHDFTMEIAVGRLYLRQLDVASFQTTLKLDGGHVLLQPMKLSLNGAPVNATADLKLDVPGYQYDINFTATKVPLAPLVNSFSTDYKDRAKGDLFANAKIKGAGTTGVNLKKSLTGDISLVLTNADIQIAGPKAKTLIYPIALVLGLNELNSTPLTGLNTQIKVGSGQISLTQFEVLSSAYRADSSGQIPIANVVKNSPINDWPVNISLTYNMASKARLLASDTPTNAAFVKLPIFAKLGGTVGKPEAKTDKLVIAGMIARSVGGISGVAGGDTGKMLQGVGGLFGVQNAPAAQTTAVGTTTNPPAASQNPAINVFDLFKKK